MSAPDQPAPGVRTDGAPQDGPPQDGAPQDGAPEAGAWEQPAQRPDETPSGPSGGPARGVALEQTSDDTDLGWGEAPDPDRERDELEEWLRAQRPPHWE